MWGSLSGCGKGTRALRGLRFAAAIGLGLGVAYSGIGGVQAQEALPEATPDLGPEYLFYPQVFGAQVPRGETVRSRQRPELDPLGLHFGSFFFFPTLENSITYDDNVFATSNNTIDDFIYTLTPAFQARSDWNRHSLTFGAGGIFAFYFDQTTENFTDAFANIGGQYDISSSTTLRARAGVRREHESRGDPNEPLGVSDPTIFMSYDAGLDGSHRFNRVTVSLGSDAIYRVYDDSELAGGGTLDNSDRDYLEMRPGVQVGYEISPSLSAFVRGQGNFVRYDEETDSGGFNRDSNGYDFVAGANVDYTGILFGDFFAGIRQRFFEDPAFSNITGPIVGSTLTWTPTGLTTVGLLIESQIIQSANNTSSGYTSSGIGVNVDHELLRNLILSGNGAFRYDDFEGITREDKFFSAGAGADYLMNRYITLGARYTFEYRDSNVSGADFTKNRIMLLVRGHL